MAMPSLFTICYFGDEVTTHFDAVNESINQCAWYSFPLKIQKNMPMMIRLAQKPVYIGTFAEIHCTRETFKTVKFLHSFQFVTLAIRFNLLSTMNIFCRLLTQHSHTRLYYVRLNEMR